jgi:hypothetical protein
VTYHVPRRKESGGDIHVAGVVVGARIVMLEVAAGAVSAMVDTGLRILCYK